MAIKFHAPTKHGAHAFAPGVAYAFEDDGAEPYFLAAKFAEETDDDAVVVMPAGSIEVDPETVFGTNGVDLGKRVLED